MITHKPKQKAGTSFPQLSQKRDGFTNWPGEKGNCFSIFRKTQPLPKPWALLKFGECAFYPERYLKDDKKRKLICDMAFKL